MRRLAIGLVLLVAVGCSGAESREGGGVEMTSAQSFAPETITVTVGDTVRWDNASTEQHTVTAEQGSLPEDAAYFASGGPTSEEAAKDDLADGFIGPGETYTHTFETPGTYRYYCIPHKEAGMVGTVVVEAG